MNHLQRQYIFIPKGGFLDRLVLWWLKNCKS